MPREELKWPAEFNRPVTNCRLLLDLTTGESLSLPYDFGQTELSRKAIDTANILIRKNMVTTAVIFCPTEIRKLREIRKEVKEIEKRAERQAIINALNNNAGVIRHAARDLGLQERTLAYKIYTVHKIDLEVYNV